MIEEPIRDRYDRVYLKTMCLFNWVGINGHDPENESLYELGLGIQTMLTYHMNHLMNIIYKYPLDLKEFKHTLTECNDYKLIYDFKFEFDYRNPNKIIMGINISRRFKDLFEIEAQTEKMEKLYSICRIDKEKFESLDEFYKINIICMMMFDLMESYKMEKIHFNKMQNKQYINDKDDDNKLNINKKNILDKIIPYSILVKDSFKTYNENNRSSKELQLKYTIVK